MNYKSKTLCLSAFLLHSQHFEHILYAKHRAGADGAPLQSSPAELIVSPSSALYLTSGHGPNQPIHTLWTLPYLADVYSKTSS